VGYIDIDQSQPPAWADPKLWQQAADAVGLGTPDEDRYPEPYVVVAYLYRKMGGQVAGAQGAQEGAGAPPPTAPGVKPPPAPAAPQKPEADVQGISPQQVRGAAGKLAAAKKSPPAPGGPKVPPKPGAKPPMQGPLKPPIQAAEGEDVPLDPEIEAKLKGEPPEEGQVPSWVADGELWAKAEASVKPKWASLPDPWVAVTQAYLKLGGQVN
jgi:hypothetical protein